jgi:hypothetical protein
MEAVGLPRRRRYAVNGSDSGQKGDGEVGWHNSIPRIAILSRSYST